MKLSYNWLKKNIKDLPKPEKLVDLLNTKVANVEEVIKLGEKLENIIVAKVKDFKKHPNADKLQLVDVKTKINGKEVDLRVVCGAFNMEKGNKVPLALPGSKIADGTMIKSQTIRGEKSKGMLCAEDELGVGDDHTGILILDKDVKIGEDVSKVLGMDDVILDVENKSITNRPDLFNHVGFAREIAAALGKKLDFEYPTYKDKKDKTDIKVEVKDKKGCQRYMAIVLDNIEVKESPDWVKSFLRSYGLEPINNIVDITNYVLVEIGQPLHAFDRDKIKGDKIVVRKAKKGERLLCLDNESHELGPKDTVIADKDNPIAVAGVVGGKPTSIDKNTQTIVIESACFDPVSIRKTSRRIDSRTDSAIRFEKDLPLKFAEYGMYRAIDMIKELAGGKVKTKIIDKQIKKLKKRKEIKFKPKRLRNFIGTDISDKEIKDILNNIGCKVKEKGKKLLVTPPMWRNDLNIFEDIVEEVLRLYGLKRVDPKPIKAHLKPQIKSKEKRSTKNIRSILTGAGFDEMLNYCFYSEKDHESNIEKNDNVLELDNPVNSKNYILRTSLLPLLFNNAKQNSDHFNEFKIFEIGRIFYKENGKRQEEKKIAGVVKSKKDLFLKAKAGLDVLFKRLDLEYDLETKKDHIAQISVDGKNIGICGEKDFGFFEIDLNSLIELYKDNKKYNKISPYPTFKRDLAFLVDKDINWGKIKDQVQSVSNLIKEVELFDVFEDEKFGDKRNIAFHIIYQSDKETLKSEKIDNIQDKIIKRIENKFKAKLRDF